MEKLQSLKQFDLLYDRLIHAASHALSQNVTVVITAGTCGQASGSNQLIRAAKKKIIKDNLFGKIQLRITGCYGFCESEPSILIDPTRTFYPKVSPEKIDIIIENAMNGTVVSDLLFYDAQNKKVIEKLEDIPFFKNQKRMLLSRNEKVDPIRIYNYIETGGYKTVRQLLDKNNPEWIVEQIKQSGLRGRGGGGFPTGKKWDMLAQQGNHDHKYLICNADEGDPGAYMDRSVLEGNPHSIIEGMLIGALGTGATEGIIYVRKEYPLAIKHLVIALQQAQELGIIGDSIFGTGKKFNISIVKGAGAFVCGEETALIKSIEGCVGEPRQRPPYPVNKGVFGYPTIINNVETWANISIIINEGSEAYSSIGIPNNSGTKIFSLVGKVKNTGLVEIPMGVSINQIVYGIGGGSSTRYAVKAIQTGGPSGGCIPADKFDMPVDYDSLSKAGSIMGSGGMIVMDERTCMVDIAKYFMNFLKDESCGKCFTCRKGTQRMYELLDDISQGNATIETILLLEEVAQTVKETTLCGLGQTASNPVLSTLRYFKQEYIEHVVEKKCKAGICKKLFNYTITDDCIGCLQCKSVCTVNAIEGSKKRNHAIDQSKCMQCGACIDVCKRNAIVIS